MATEDAARFDRHVFVCVHRRDKPPFCGSPEADAVRQAFKEELRDRGLRARMRVNAAGCLDQCAKGVSVVVYPEQVWYGNVTVGDVGEIVREHLVADRPLARLRVR